MAGNTIELGYVRDIPVVVKTAACAQTDLTQEAAYTRALLGREGFVQYVDHTRTTLLTELVVADGSHWSGEMLERAVHVTRSMPELPHKDRMRIMGQHTGDQEKILTGLVFAPDTRLRLMVEETSEQLSSWPVGDLSAAHCDTRPENWVLSDSGPVLIDFGAVALAPQDWDAALLLAHSSVDIAVKRGVSKHLGVDWGLVRLAAGFYLGLAWYFRANSHSSNATNWAKAYEDTFTQVLRGYGQLHCP